MSVALTLLGLLETGSRHGYDLKREYDEHFAGAKPLAYGQVYATLARLTKSGLIEIDGVESGAGPDRKRYAITPEGVSDVEEWLRTPESPQGYLHNTLQSKVVVAVLTGRSPTDVLDAQRTAHLAAMRELTTRKQQGDVLDALICDHAIFHLDADLKWLELTAGRLVDIEHEVQS